jgi:PAS domain S-box-containing protein
VTGQRDDEMFRLLVENVRDYAIFMLDPGGHVASWNSGAEYIKGYTRDEILGRHFSVFYTPDAVARHWPQHELSAALEQGRFEDEGWRLRKDGTTFWANVVITPVYDRDQRLRGFAKITRDLTARRKTEELQRSERRMNEFLAMLAHELRNPLAPIQSALEVAERKPDDPAVVGWSRTIIQRQTAQLARLVDDLLDVSRITQGKLSLRREPVDVKATVSQIIESLRPRIEARHQVIELQLPDIPLEVEADPTRIAQIVSNLLDNAMKYTPEGGRITISATIVDEFVSIAVSDSGIGMSADLVPRVFDLFVQGERGLDRRDGGLGVGLTIARRLAELQGGTMSGGSAGPGLGSRFVLQLPLLRRSAAAPANRLPANAAPPSRQTRVMIVDDNRDAAETLAALVELLGHDAVIAHDGEEALRLATARAPDVILLDIGLPGMNGYEVAGKLREAPGTRGVRLVACTGYGRGEGSHSVGGAPFDAHFVKPVTAAQLEAMFSEMTHPDHAGAERPA